VYDLTIVGIVGLPAEYGGFETVAENLVREFRNRYSIQVFCTSRERQALPARYLGADLRYVAWSANGWQSVIYDAVSLCRAARTSRAILVLGVSGGLMLPLIRAVAPHARIVTNIDGLEWKRRKWGYLARAFLRLSERAAVRFSNVVVADNQGIADYIQETYGRIACRIPYGGDASPRLTFDAVAEQRGSRFAAGSYYVAVCRIEPDNSVEELLGAFATNQSVNIVVVGNWNVSKYSRELRARHSGRPNIDLLDPVYDRQLLDEIREGAKAYVHGHTAGGTNPSLVEAMSLGLAVLAYDVNYNRFTTNNQAAYWATPKELANLVSSLCDSDLVRNASAMLEYARQHYTWAKVSSAYADVIFPEGQGLA